MGNFTLKRFLTPWLILLICILSLGFTLRVINLSTNPYGFFADEASIGYNAYILLATGHDEHGFSWPLFFKAFGEYKNPIQTYSAIPFIKIFGLNEFSTRLPSVLYGVGGVIAIFFLAQELFKKTSLNVVAALFASFFLAISPWHIQFSRTSLEGLTAYVFFTIIGTLFFIKARTKPPYLLISTISFGCALYSYFPARIFIPLFVLTLIIGNIKHLWLQKKFTILAFFLTVGILAPLLSSIRTSEGLSRWNQVSIFSQTNQNTSTISHIATNYISHFSVEFLFTKGDIDMPGRFITRHSVRGIGELYLIQLPLVIFGLYFLVWKKWWGTFLILLSWLLLYPLGSAFTIDESVQATRSIIGVVPFQLLSACGILYLFKLTKNAWRNGVYISILILITVSVAHFGYKFFVEYPKYSADFWGWQYGPGEIVHYFVEHEEEYDELIMTGEFNAPDIFFKFYAPNKCAHCFVGSPDTNLSMNKRQLFAVTPTFLKERPHLNFLPQKNIYYPNGNLAFQIGTITN